MGNAPFAANFAEIWWWHMQDRGWRTIGDQWLIDFAGQRAVSATLRRPPPLPLLI
jgi:hypothetical protein